MLNCMCAIKVNYNLPMEPPLIVASHYGHLCDKASVFYFGRFHTNHFCWLYFRFSVMHLLQCEAFTDYDHVLQLGQDAVGAYTWASLY